MAIKNKDVEFLRAKPLAGHLNDYIDSLYPPFFGADPFSFLKKISNGFVGALEKFAGAGVYVKKKRSPLEQIPPRFHSLLVRLRQEGLLKNIFYPEPIAGWPRIPAVAANISSPASTNSGYALDYDSAATKAIAEALERYSFSVYEEKDLTIGTWENLKNQGAINPGQFAAFSENQLGLKDYKRHQIKNDSEFAWTKCVSLADGSKHLIPAQLVYLGYKFFTGEPQIRQTTTNGGAAGASLEMAVYNAICEAVERDSFLIYWLNKITPPQLDVFNSDNEDIRKLAELYKKHEIDFSVLDITTDINVPAVITVVREKTRGMPSIFVSPKADLDIENAIVYSMIDGLRSGFWPLVSLKEIEKIRQKAQSPENIEERHIYWCDKSLIKEGNFLFAGGIKKIEKNEFALAPLKLKLEKLKEIFKNKNLEVYLADAASKPAKEAGLWVVMSLIPELCPLYLNEHFKYLGMKRLYEAPVKMGIFERPKKEEEMNKTPHPML